ncbi:glycosyltransferase family 4 protein [Fibrobacter succinogenes]|nr:glycosyltransferase family 1 protein [Fibrobacter succinogenes]
MKKIVFFHRNIKCGFSINKVTQTVIQDITCKKEYFVPRFGANLFSILINIVFVFMHRDRRAVNHITGDIHYCILGLIGCNSVLTIHDTVLIDFQNHPFFKKKIFEWLWFRLPLKFATRIVCISEETKKSVLRYTNRSDIEVVHNAIDLKFKYSPKELNLDKPRILIIGTNPNKNLLRVFDALKNQSFFIVVVGKLNEEQKKFLDLNGFDYENKINLSDNEIVEEYKKSDIVSFVSLYEGFGMPVIEANAIGRPVICSDIPVLREVARNSALFVNPYDVVAIKNAFLELKRDRLLCLELVECGLRNVNRFKKEIIQKQWDKIYQKV